MSTEHDMTQGMDEEVVPSTWMDALNMRFGLYKPETVPTESETAIESLLSWLASPHVYNSRERFDNQKDILYISSSTPKKCV